MVGLEVEKDLAGTEVVALQAERIWRRVLQKWIQGRIF